MKNSTIFRNKTVRTSAIVILWLFIWQAAVLLVDNPILLVGPADVAVTFVKELGRSDFYKSIGFSMLKIGFGYFAGMAAGILFAVFAWKSTLFERFINPAIAFIKAAPVASFVVLFLIWWRSSVLSVAICICVVLPQIYVSVLKGLKSTYIGLIEMADVFRLHPIDRIHYIYRPSVCEHLESAVKLSASMAWKAGVAAEVIGTPDDSIGSLLYLSKISLDTAEVLTYTAVIIILSIICEKILLKLLSLYKRHEFGCIGPDSHRTSGSNIHSLVLDKICKAFDDKYVLDGYSDRIDVGHPKIYTWKSGAGKTTLFRIIAGLESADSGSVSPMNPSVTMLFQENRLIEDFSAVKNCEIVCSDKNRVRDVLLKLLGPDEISRPVKTLSGGQKRRVALARTLLKDSDIAIFDEPYEGLDEKNRLRVRELIEEYANDRIVLVSSHIEDH